MKVIYAIPEEVYSERLVGWHDEGLLDSDICCDMQIFQFLNYTGSETRVLPDLMLSKSIALKIS